MTTAAPIFTVTIMTGSVSAEILSAAAAPLMGNALPAWKTKEAVHPSQVQTDQHPQSETLCG